MTFIYTSFLKSLTLLHICNVLLCSSKIQIDFFLVWFIKLLCLVSDPIGLQLNWLLFFSWITLVVWKEEMWHGQLLVVHLSLSDPCLLAISPHMQWYKTESHSLPISFMFELDWNLMRDEPCRLAMTLNCIRWGGSYSQDLRKVKYSFSVITPWSSLTQSQINCQNLKRLLRNIYTENVHMNEWWMWFCNL